MAAPTLTGMTPIGGSAFIHISLLGMTFLLAGRGRRGHRLLALIPLGTVFGILLYVTVGGVLLLGTWLTAAAVALALPARATVPVEPRPTVEAPGLRATRPRPARAAPLANSSWDARWLRVPGDTSAGGVSRG